MLGPWAAEESDQAGADFVLADDGLLFVVDLGDDFAAGGGLLGGQGI